MLTEWESLPNRKNRTEHIVSEYKKQSYPLRHSYNSWIPNEKAPIVLEKYAAIEQAMVGMQCLSFLSKSEPMVRLDIQDVQRKRFLK